MGKENERTNEDIVADLDEVFGFGDDDGDDTPQEPATTADDDTNTDDDTKDTQTPPKANETPKSDNITLTPQQVEINSDIAKIDVQIEELQKHEVDEDDFYATLDDTLSEEEEQLEFDDKKAYTKLLVQKRDEYLAKNSKADEIKELKEQRDELSSMYERQSAITSVSAKYPQYEHEKMVSFFENDLTKNQQQEIFNGAKSYADVYEATYKVYAKLNPTSVKEVKTPDIPDVNNVRKQDVKPQALEDGLKSDDEELQDALGL